jgi:O-acetyl-ADP-ribose deacetylase (regulator of RNase III)
MIYNITDCVFRQFEVVSERCVLAHQANCRMVMGGGIAAKIRQKYPEAYEADLKFRPASPDKRLGLFSWVKTAPEKYIANVYGQLDIGRGKQTSYDALSAGLSALERWTAKERVETVFVPHGMGSGLAGGYWPVVNALIYEAFDASPVDVIIVKLP